MLNNSWKNGVLALLALTALTLRAETINGININFSNIGNIGNTNDSSGYGAVGYNYRIGKYEITASQWAVAFAADPRVGVAGSWAGEQPAGLVTWYEAAKFCNWLTTTDAYTGVYQFDGGGSYLGMDRSYRNGSGVAYVLPTENEWYKAAYFKPDASGYSLYANGSGATPLDVYTPNQTGWNYNGSSTTNMGAPWAVGGSMEEQNGTYDMMGNVWEWTEEAQASGNGNFWGGAYNSSLSDLQSGDPDPVIDPPNSQYDTVGFRIASVPEPGTLSLMSLSTLGLFATRSMRRRKLLGKSLIPIGRERLCDAFCSLEEWESEYDEIVISDGLDITIQLAKAKVLVVWTGMQASYKMMDRKFWDYMVVSHECRLARKKAFRAKLKQKALNGLDAFLALIMK